MVLKEFFICVSCLYKQIPFVFSWSEVRINTLDFCISPSDLRKYRPILRPIFVVVRYQIVYLFVLILFSLSDSTQGMAKI